MLSPKWFTALAALARVAAARDVFVHYMAQTLTLAHATDDVQTAMAMGVDAFVINIGEPDSDWCKEMIDNMFTAAAGTDFKLFFSLDLYANPDPYAFSDLINKYSVSPNYYVGGAEWAPMLSTFLDASWSPASWDTFLDSLDSNIYFVPMFDQSPGYYADPDGFWDAWNDTLDGCFSWERSWPGQSESRGDLTIDLDVSLMSTAHSNHKAYMMGLSTLQYKHYYGSHWFRAGDVVMGQRMTQILNMTDLPDFVQIQTWNDGGESHYIGRLSSEGLLPDMLLYANQDEHPHTGWQPIFTSFITAFKNGDKASGMRPPSGVDVVGAMWHHEILSTASCSDDDLGKPEGQGAVLDTVNWAVVVADGITDYYVQVWSGGEMISHEPITTGLNFLAVSNVNLGVQVVQVVDADGTVILQGGDSTKGISAEMSGEVCNYNFQVAELVAV